MRENDREVSSHHAPTALALTRQKLPTLDRNIYAPAVGLRKGAYVLKEAEGGSAEVVLIGTGSEVALIVEAQKLLARNGEQAVLHERAAAADRVEHELRATNQNRG